MFNTVAKKRNEKSEAELSIHNLLEYVRTEVVVLQNQIRNQMDPNKQKENVANDECQTEVMGTMAMETMLWDALFSIIFDAETLDAMSGFLTGETFAIMLDGLALAADESHQKDLRTPFVLSLYPKGRKDIKIIQDNMHASPMRRAASHRFMHANDANSQITILKDAQKKLEKLYKNHVRHIKIDEKNTVQSSISRAYHNVSCAY